MLEPLRIRDLVAEILAAGHCAREVTHAWSEDVLGVVADHDVDWSDPRRPCVAAARVRDFADAPVWRHVREAHPTWVNVAAYETTDGRAVLVLAWSRRALALPCDPAISLSRAGPGARLLVA